MKIKVVGVLLSVALMVPLVVAAQTNPCSGGPTGNLGACVSQIYIWSLGISATLAVVMTVYGGYMVMMSRGNAQQATKGKSYIYSSLIGMLLLAGAYVLLNTINTDLTDFNVPDLESEVAPTPGPGQTPTPGEGDQPTGSGPDILPVDNSDQNPDILDPDADHGPTPPPSEAPRAN